MSECLVPACMLLMSDLEELHWLDYFFNLFHYCTLWVHVIPCSIALRINFLYCKNNHQQ